MRITSKGITSKGSRRLGADRGYLGQFRVLFGERGRGLPGSTLRGRRFGRRGRLPIRIEVGLLDRGRGHPEPIIVIQPQRLELHAPQRLDQTVGVHPQLSAVEQVFEDAHLEISLGGLPRQEVEQRLQLMCEKLIANTVIEDFRFEFQEE